MEEHSFKSYFKIDKLNFCFIFSSPKNISKLSKKQHSVTENISVVVIYDENCYDCLAREIS